MPQPVMPPDAEPFDVDPALILNLYAGGLDGWSHAADRLGLARPLGYEADPVAAVTRLGLNLRSATLGDVTTARAPGRPVGVIASPPCQTFSAAGAGGGRVMVGRICTAIANGAWHAVDPDRSAGWGHVLELGRWVETLRPTWVVAEQVPEVAPVWAAYSHRWSRLGYAVWAAVANAANYGDPQTRRRAVLVARRDGPAVDPVATHAQVPYPSLLGDARLPWVTMAEALGWGPPPPATSHEARWPWSDPATTVTGDPRISARCHHNPGEQGRGAVTTDDVRAGRYDGRTAIRLSLAEALTLQGFDPLTPIAGNQAQQHQQVGNACPLGLATAMLRAATA